MSDEFRKGLEAQSASMHEFQDAPVDPVCLVHGKRRSEHDCLYCCLCFKSLTPDECHEDDDGVRWDVCNDCARMEAMAHAAQI